MRDDVMPEPAQRDFSTQGSSGRDRRDFINAVALRHGWEGGIRPFPMQGVLGRLVVV